LAQVSSLFQAASRGILLLFCSYPPTVSRLLREEMAAAALKEASWLLESQLTTQVLDRAGTMLSSCKDVQSTTQALPLQKLVELPQLLSDLSGALSRAAADPSSLLQGGGCFAGCIARTGRKVADAKIRALEQESSSLSENISQARTQVEKTCADLLMGLMKLSDSTPEKVQELQGIPKELMHLGDLAQACKFAEIDLSRLKNAADVSPIQTLISEVLSLMQQVKESLVNMADKVIKDVLDFVVGAPKRLLDAGTGDLPFQCIRGLLPQPKPSESTNAMLNKIKDISALASQVCEGMKGSSDQSGVDEKLQEFSASLGKFTASVNDQVDQLQPAVQAAKEAADLAAQAKGAASLAAKVADEAKEVFSEASSGLGGILAAGKESRGATAKDGYKFGDVTRGLVSEAKHLLGRDKPK